MGTWELVLLPYIVDHRTRSAWAVPHAPQDKSRPPRRQQIEQKKDILSDVLVLALPIFTARHQATIVGVSELNFCVRDGNRWTLTTINTNSHRIGFEPILYINLSEVIYFGDPYRIRTDVNGVRGRCLNHLTNGPFGPLSGTRTRDPLIKSQLLYQLS